MPVCLSISSSVPIDPTVQQQRGAMSGNMSRVSSRTKQIRAARLKSQKRNNRSRVSHQPRSDKSSRGTNNLRGGLCTPKGLTSSSRGDNKSSPRVIEWNVIYNQIQPSEVRKRVCLLLLNRLWTHAISKNDGDTQDVLGMASEGSGVAKEDILKLIADVGDRAPLDMEAFLVSRDDYDIEVVRKLVVLMSTKYMDSLVERVDAYNTTTIFVQSIVERVTQENNEITRNRGGKLIRVVTDSKQKTSSTPYEIPSTTRGTGVTVDHSFVPPPIPRDAGGASDSSNKSVGTGDLSFVPPPTPRDTGVTVDRSFVPPPIHRDAGGASDSSNKSVGTGHFVQSKLRLFEQLNTSGDTPNNKHPNLKPGMSPARPRSQPRRQPAGPTKPGQANGNLASRHTPHNVGNPAAFHPAHVARSMNAFGGAFNVHVLNQLRVSPAEYLRSFLAVNAQPPPDNPWPNLVQNRQNTHEAGNVDQEPSGFMKFNQEMYYLYKKLMVTDTPKSTDERQRAKYFAALVEFKKVVQLAVKLSTAVCEWGNMCTLRMNRIISRKRAGGGTNPTWTLGEGDPVVKCSFDYEDTTTNESLLNTITTITDLIEYNPANQQRDNKILSAAQLFDVTYDGQTVHVKFVGKFQGQEEQTYRKKRVKSKKKKGTSDVKKKTLKKKKKTPHKDQTIEWGATESVNDLSDLPADGKSHPDNMSVFGWSVNPGDISRCDEDALLEGYTAIQALGVNGGSYKEDQVQWFGGSPKTHEHGIQESTPQEGTGSDFVPDYIDQVQMPTLSPNNSTPWE